MITAQEMQEKILKLTTENEASKAANLEAKLKRERLERKINDACFAVSVYSGLAVTPLVIASCLGGGNNGTN